MVFCIQNRSSELAIELKAAPNTRMQSDRFAREIVTILAHSGAARSRRLMRNPLGGPQSRRCRKSLVVQALRDLAPAAPAPRGAPIPHTPLPRAALPHHEPRAATRWRSCRQHIPPVVRAAPRRFVAPAAALRSCGIKAGVELTQIAGEN